MFDKFRTRVKEMFRLAWDPNINFEDVGDDRLFDFSVDNDGKVYCDIGDLCNALVNGIVRVEDFEVSSLSELRDKLAEDCDTGPVVKIGGLDYIYSTVQKDKTEKPLRIQEIDSLIRKIELLDSSSRSREAIDFGRNRVGISDGVNVVLLEKYFRDYLPVNKKRDNDLIDFIANRDNLDRNNSEDAAEIFVRLTEEFPRSAAAISCNPSFEDSAGYVKNLEKELKVPDVVKEPSKLRKIVSMVLPALLAGAAGAGAILDDKDSSHEIVSLENVVDDNVVDDKCIINELAFTRGSNPKEEGIKLCDVSSSGWYETMVLTEDYVFWTEMGSDSYHNLHSFNLDTKEQKKLARFLTITNCNGLEANSKYVVAQNYDSLISFDLETGKQKNIAIDSDKGLTDFSLKDNVVAAHCAFLYSDEFDCAVDKINLETGVTSNIFNIYVGSGGISLDGLFFDGSAIYFAMNGTTYKYYSAAGHKQGSTDDTILELTDKYCAVTSGEYNLNVYNLGFSKKYCSVEDYSYMRDWSGQLTPDNKLVYLSSSSGDVTILDLLNGEKETHAASSLFAYNAGKLAFIKEGALYLIDPSGEYQDADLPVYDKIIFTSDVHLTPENLDYIKYYYAQIELKNPDLIVVGGDIADCSKYLYLANQVFDKKDGKYYTKSKGIPVRLEAGNHDAYKGEYVFGNRVAWCPYTSDGFKEYEKQIGLTDVNGVDLAQEFKTSDSKCYRLVMFNSGPDNKPLTPTQALRDWSHAPDSSGISDAKLAALEKYAGSNEKVVFVAHHPVVHKDSFGYVGNPSNNRKALEDLVNNNNIFMVSGHVHDAAVRHLSGNAVEFDEIPAAADSSAYVEWDTKKDVISEPEYIMARFVEKVFGPAELSVFSSTRAGQRIGFTDTGAVEVGIKNGHFSAVGSSLDDLTTTISCPGDGTSLDTEVLVLQDGKISLYAITGDYSEARNTGKKYFELVNLDVKKGERLVFQKCANSDYDSTAMNVNVYFDSDNVVDCTTTAGGLASVLSQERVRFWGNQENVEETEPAEKETEPANENYSSDNSSIIWIVGGAAAGLALLGLAGGLVYVVKKPRRNIEGDLEPSMQQPVYNYPLQQFTAFSFPNFVPSLPLIIPVYSPQALALRTPYPNFMPVLPSIVQERLVYTPRILPVSPGFKLTREPRTGSVQAYNSEKMSVTSAPKEILRLQEAYSDEELNADLAELERLVL